MKSIDVKINGEDGSLEMDAVGFHGEGCEHELNRLMTALGQEEARTREDRAEYHEQTDQQHRHG